MEYRKLIKFGNSSYIVSVPNDWIKKNNLKKGNSVSISEDTNSNLVLSVDLKEDSLDRREISINIDEKDIQRIRREIISAYINNYNLINIEGKELNKFIKEIKQIIQNLMALEIVDQTADRLITKDFLDINEVAFNEILRKIDTMTRSMITDAKLILDKSYENYSTSIYSRDEEVNRLVYLIMRVTRLTLDYPYLTNKKNKLNTSEILDIWDVTLSIERIADAIKRTARELNKIKNQSRIIKEVIDILDDIEAFYLNTMKAYYNDDIEAAYELSSNKKILAEKCDILNDKYWNIKYVPIVLENLKDVISSIHNIGRRIYS